MAKGSVEPEYETDKQCPYCEKYYSNRGWKSHVRDCPAQPKNATHPWDKETETMSDNTDESDSFDGVICPACTNRDDSNGKPIYNANENMKKNLNNRGVLTKSRAKAIDNNDYFCADCNTLFREDEI